MTVDDGRLNPSALPPVDPTLPDRLADLARTPVETEWVRRATGGWQDPEMAQSSRPSRMEIESETGVAFFRGMLNAVAFSAMLAMIVAAVAIITSG